MNPVRLHEPQKYSDIHASLARSLGSACSIGYCASLTLHRIRFGNVVLRGEKGGGETNNNKANNNQKTEKGRSNYAKSFRAINTGGGICVVPGREKG